MSVLGCGHTCLPAASLVSQYGRFETRLSGYSPLFLSRRALAMPTWAAAVVSHCELAGNGVGSRSSSVRSRMLVCLYSSARLLDLILLMVPLYCRCDRYGGDVEIHEASFLIGIAGGFPQGIQGRATMLRSA